MMNLLDLIKVREKVAYFLYPKLSLNLKFAHGVFTRLGGVSEAPYNTLNTSFSTGDRPEDVSSNLLKVREAIGATHLLFMNQCHGHKIVVITEEHIEATDEAPSADALITSIPGIALMVKQADCQGVIIFDPKREVVANVHCGWRGSVQNILGLVVARMKQAFGCEVSELMAAISPSLGPCCAEFITHEEIFPSSFQRFMVRKDYFDLWALSCSQLLEAGLREVNIELARVCTKCRTDLFYSYRGEGKTGRFGTVAMLI